MCRYHIVPIWNCDRDAVCNLAHVFHGNICVHVVKKMVGCASVCNGALLCRTLRTVGTVRGSFLLSRLEDVFTTAFLIY